VAAQQFDYGERDSKTGQFQNHPVRIGKKRVQPLRDTYRHLTCGKTTSINDPNIVLTYSTTPHFYTGTFCAPCKSYYSLTEFVWLPDEVPMNRVSGDPTADLRFRKQA